MKNEQARQAGWTLALVTAILAGGCAMVGPDFETPEAKVAERWANDNAPCTRAGQGFVEKPGLITTSTL